LVYVQINIPAMQATVDALAMAIREMPDAAAGIRRRLDYVGLSAPGLAAWLPGGSAEAELRDVLRDMRNRLDKAIEVERMTVGFAGSGGPMLVGFEEDPDVDLADADTVADLLGQIAVLDPMSVPGDAETMKKLLPQLERLLAAGAGDTAFCLRLSRLVGPAALAAGLDRVDLVLGGLPGRRDGAGAASEYAGLLDNCGRAWSAALGALAPGSPARTGFVQEWRDVVVGAGPGDPPPQLLALVIAHGDWPDDFLSGMADAIMQDAVGGIDRWANLVTWPNGLPTSPDGQERAIVDPSMATTPNGDTLPVVDPLYGVLMASALHDPGWIAAWCGDDQVEVSWDQGGLSKDPDKLTEQVSGLANARIHDLFENRGLDVGSFQALRLAVAAGDVASAPSSLPDDWAPQLSNSVWRMAAKQVRDGELYEAKSWWEKHGHQILGAGILTFGALTLFLPSGAPTMIAGAAMVGVTIADASWYFADGDFADGTLDLAFLLVPVLIGATVRVLRLAPALLASLRSGAEVEAFGGVLSMNERGLLAVNGTGRGAPFIRIDPTYGLPAAQYGVLSKEQVKVVEDCLAALKSGSVVDVQPPKGWDPMAPYGRDAAGVALTRSSTRFAMFCPTATTGIRRSWTGRRATARSRARYRITRMRGRSSRTMACSSTASGTIPAGIWLLKSTGRRPPGASGRCRYARWVRSITSTSSLGSCRTVGASKQV